MQFFRCETTNNQDISSSELDSNSSTLVHLQQQVKPSSIPQPNNPSLTVPLIIIPPDSQQNVNITPQIPILPKPTDFAQSVSAAYALLALSSKVDVGVQCDGVEGDTSLKRVRKSTSPGRHEHAAKRRRQTAETQTRFTSQKNKNKHSSETQTQSHFMSKKALSKKVKKSKGSQCTSNKDYSGFTVCTQTEESALNSLHFDSEPMLSDMLGIDTNLADLLSPTDSNSLAIQTSPPINFSYSNSLAIQTSPSVNFNYSNSLAIQTSPGVDFNWMNSLQTGDPVETQSHPSTSTIDFSVLDTQVQASIETQTEFDFNESFYNDIELPDDLSNLFSNTTTQTCDEILDIEDLLYSNMCTQTVDPMFPNSHSETQTPVVKQLTAIVKSDMQVQTI